MWICVPTRSFGADRRRRASPTPKITATNEPPQTNRLSLNRRLDEFARLFFPYTLLLTRWTGNTISLPLILLALAQFPLYGGLIGLCRDAKRAASVALLIFVAHAAAAAVCFSGAIPIFS
jgi:hypothetical protein